jgi:17beta-estradiol 17-dehydrogenase / very-long-chain 3-oxoacyl-CoA reductase
VRPPVVTGASDGIGREFALQLARAGFGVVLVARNAEKLAAVAAECGGATKVVALDFADKGASFAELEGVVKELDVGVLGEWALSVGCLLAC